MNDDSNTFALQDAENSVVDLVSDDESIPNSPQNLSYGSNEETDNMRFDHEYLSSLIDKYCDEAVESNEPYVAEQQKTIDIVETDLGLCEHTLRDCEEISDYLRTKIERLSVHLTKEETFVDVVRQTEDGFLEVSGPFKKILPISFSSNKVIREASYDSNKKYELTGSSSGFGISEDVLPDFDSKDDIDFMESHRQLYLQSSDDGSVERPVLNVGDDVYAATGAICSNHWKLAVIKSIENNLFTIKFSADFMPELRVDSKKLAYTSIPFTLKIGLRVIAHFRKERSDPSYDCPLLSGMIAEAPKISNEGRYLIFFDNGCVCYASPGEVFLIHADPKPWDEIEDVDYKNFIKRYCEEYPEKKMLRFQKGQKVKVRRKEKWTTHCIVEEVDCSLVKVYYEKSNETEWLYRGSIRLYPIYSQVIELQKVKESNSLKPRRNPVSKKGCTNFLGGFSCIQYTFEEDSSEVSRHVSTPKAKKRTAKFLSIKSQSNLKDAKTLRIVSEIPALFTENMERVLERYSHECFIHCIKGIDESLSNFKNVNPYAIPILCKWKREVRADIHTRQNRRSKIVYITPCGNELVSMHEIYEYLRITRSTLYIDFFSFEVNLEVYNSEQITFKPYYYNPDLACGKEFHAISVVNEVDTERPDHFEYSEKNVAGPGVELRFDNDFLSCCDCEDDCISAENCSCRRNTIDIAGQTCGYEFRRLPDFVMTGIFECNSSCRCSQRCMNRVVQLGIRVQLQLFKTRGKGWGVRTLHDVPKGSFICTYSAEVINDSSLPEDDKYFADLDLIDVCERAKEGYESSVESCEEEEEIEERPRKRIKYGPSDVDNSPSPIRRNSALDERFSIREYHNEDFSYLLDAQKIGNIGRYLNHSCEPNCFVQNVFVETHDLRFPRVSIFAYKHIKALEEVCWDYNYVVDSVPGKRLWCACGSSHCRGRLL
ncbi:histone-lysine N-methyltransferase: setb1-like protein [Leptotrombidium deliense]|uniref:Histone-lysine N-methyltransferase: setb1-like protein n=1 Tax=Leptotrombidium deliense TaxID=299467 RepID=A0A443SQK2_9ACAR|nr:histone-lysine N-methyltransferase: setb1-like protein [Leptotrombidium deliense]